MFHTQHPSEAYRAEGEWELRTTMRMPGPYYDDIWDWPQAKKAEGAPRTAADENSPRRIAWELGLVLLVPLAGAGIVELVLMALRVY